MSIYIDAQGAYLQVTNLSLTFSFFIQWTYIICLPKLRKLYTLKKCQNILTHNTTNNIFHGCQKQTRARLKGK